jgi:hypothetical protein
MDYEREVEITWVESTPEAFNADLVAILTAGYEDIEWNTWHGVKPRWWHRFRFWR